MQVDWRWVSRNAQSLPTSWLFYKQSYVVLVQAEAEEVTVTTASDRKLTLNTCRQIVRCHVFLFRSHRFTSFWCGQLSFFIARAHAHAYAWVYILQIVRALAHTHTRVCKSSQNWCDAMCEQEPLSKLKVYVRSHASVILYVQGWTIRFKNDRTHRLCCTNVSAPNTKARTYAGR